MTARENEGLRSALREIQTAGWQGHDATEVLDALAVRVGSIVARFSGSRRESDRAVVDLRDDLLSRGWEFLSDRLEVLVEHPAPWGLVLAHLQQEATRSVSATVRLTSERAIRDGRSATHAEPAALLEPATLVQITDQPTTGSALTPAFSAAVDLLVDALDDAGLRDAEAAVECGLTVVLATRPSYWHTRAYESTELAELGLSRAQVRGLMDLLVGTRRGGPASSTLRAVVAAVRAGRDVQVSAATPISAASLASAAGVPSTARVA